MEDRVRAPYHFIGIGGVGMSSLASLLLESGCAVSGSDVSHSAYSKRLEKQGIRFFCGHAASHIEGAGCVVYSTAIQSYNPELLAARQMKIPVVHRSELLADFVKSRELIAVSGTHGKTTTASLIAHIFHKAHLDPSFMIGGTVSGFGSNARLGEGPYFVIEADESDGSCTNYSPKILALTNLDMDHREHFQDKSQLVAMFRDYVTNLDSAVEVLIYGADNTLNEVVQGCRASVSRYGYQDDWDVCAQSIVLRPFDSEYSLYLNGRYAGRVCVSIPGSHNVLNSLAAVGVAHMAGISFEVLREALASFGGVKRRFEVKGVCQGARVIDDYAHHPKEVEAVLAVARVQCKGNLWVVFQPHRYSRLSHFRDEFAEVLYGVQRLIVMDVFSASEKNVEGFDAINFTELVNAKRSLPAVQISDHSDIVRYLVHRLSANDMVLFLGAGDSSDCAEKLVREHL